MKQNVKRILSTILLSTMLSGIFPMTAFASGAKKDYDWQGKWIWTSDPLPNKTGEGQWVNLRKTFTLKEIPAVAQARISVDSRYWMWVNGELVVYEGQLKMGPDQHSWYYDVVDLAPYLKVGENTIAVLACYWGFQSATAKPTEMQGFLFDAELSKGALENGATRLISDASWKVIKNPAYETPPVRKNKRPDAVDTKYNAAKAIEGWQAVGFDDSSWKNATVKTLKDTDPRNILVERSIPQWKVEDIVKYGEEDWIITNTGDAEFSALSLPEKYSVTAEVKSLTNNTVGMTVCANDKGSFYMPQIQGKGKNIKPHVQNGGWIFPALQDGAAVEVAMSSKMTLTVEVDASNIVTYVNGTKVGSFTDTSLARKGSSVGFRSSSGEQTAVYSVKISDADGNLLWEDNISEAKAGDDVTAFAKVSGDAPILAKDENGDTYMKVHNCVIIAGKQVASPDSTKIYSFYNPTNMQGTPYLKVKSEKGGETIKITSDATMHDGGEAVTHSYVTKAGEQEWEAYNWMSAWRVNFTVPAGVEVLELGWRHSSYNTEETGYMETDNKKLNQLYREAYDTLLITMRDIYMDCPDRERTQWWGDAVLEMQQAAYAMDEEARLLYKKLLTQVVGWTEGHGASLPTTPTKTDAHYELHAQSVAGVHSLWQYYLYYGETDILETCYEPFLNFLKLWDMSDTGFLTHRAGTSDWIDWGDNVDASVSDHAWYCVAAEAMLNVAKVLGKSETDIDLLQRRVTLIRENFDTMFWNEGLGAYYSATSTGKPDDRAQAMAVYAGLADPVRYPKLLKVIKETEYASPYMEKYVLEALYKMGYAEAAIERTLKRYDGMLNDDHPTLCEDFDENKLSGNKGTGTRNHAWSGGPLSLMYMYNAGITSMGAAFETFQIRPQLGGLTYVSAKTETPYGFISVYVTKNVLNVTVPTGTKSAEICVPRLDGGATAIKLGGTVVYANGAVTSVLPAGVTYAGEDADYVKFTVCAGEYDFAMSKDTADTSASHTVTVNAVGNGTVTVNGVALQGSYTFTGTGKITVKATPASTSRVAYISGACPETVYDTKAVERSYTVDRDMTLNVVFDEPLDQKHLIKVVDTSKVSDSSVALKGMFYAYHIYVNGQEVFMKQYFRDNMLPLPYMITAKDGETVTVSVKPVSASNYGVYLKDASGKLSEEITLTVGADTELSVTVIELPGVKKLKVENVTASGSMGGSSVWKPEFLVDGERVSSFHKGFSGYCSNRLSTATPESPITITLDLGSVQSFNQISLFPRNSYEALSGGARCFPKDFTVSISEDGEHYYDVVNVTDYANPNVHQQVFDFDMVEARYVKLTVTKLGEFDFGFPSNASYCVQLTEIEVAQVTHRPSDDIAPPDTDGETGTPDTTVPDDNGGEKKKGCSSTLAGGMAAATLSAGAACIFRKKKED